MKCISSFQNGKWITYSSVWQASPLHPQMWPRENVCSIGSGLSLEVASTTQQKVLCSQQHGTLQSAGVRGGEAEEGRSVLIRRRRSHVFVYSTSTKASALITRSSLDIFIGVFILVYCVLTAAHLDILWSVYWGLPGETLLSLREYTL